MVDGALCATLGAVCLPAWDSRDASREEWASSVSSSSEARFSAAKTWDVNSDTRLASFPRSISATYSALRERCKVGDKSTQFLNMPRQRPAFNLRICSDKPTAMFRLRLPALPTLALTAVFAVPFAAVAEEEHSQPAAESHPTEDKRKEEPGTDGASPKEHIEGKEGEKESDKEKEREGAEKEPDWEVTGDFVGGATTIDVLSEGRAGGPATFDSARVAAYSLLVGVERRLGELWKVGVSIPLIAAHISSRTGEADSRSVQLVGNLEIEGGYIFAKGEHWEIEFSLGVALPTAGGKEQPSAQELADEPDKEFNFRSMDRFAAARAASVTRGLYSSSLFESGRLGLVPRISAVLRAGNLTVVPMVKVENLIDVTGDAEHSYIGEFTGGVRGSYKVTSHFEPGLHVFINARYTSPAEFDALVLEPYLRFPVGPVIPQVGVLVPVAGDIADNKTFGVRAAVTGEF